MALLLNICICSGLILSSFKLAESFGQLWSYDLIDSKVYTSNPEIMDADFNIVRIDRGRLGYNGFLDIKEDLYDDVLIHGKIERSRNKNGPFSMMPFAIVNETLSTVLNKYYKRMIMPSVEKCCTNAPVSKNKFVEPLKKCRMEATNCEIATDGMPSFMMEGYYLLRFSVFGNFEVYLEVLFYVENL